MTIILLFIPILASIAALFLYRFQGPHREVFKFDLVQFVYLFVLAPSLYIWFKSILYVVLRNELGSKLSQTDLFIIDTTFSVVSLFIIAAVAIHSVTKTIWLKKNHDPEFDIFALSEYFHLWWSHLVMWGGAMVCLSFVSIANVFFPLKILDNNQLFNILLIAGLFFGAMMFLAFSMSDPRQANYMRLIKLQLIGHVLIHVVIYYFYQPPFAIQYIGYWSTTAGFVSAAICSGFFDRHNRAARLRKFFIHKDWGNNISLFSPIENKSIKHRKNRKK